MDNIIFKEQYDGESLYDVNRDVSEAFDPRFNPAVKDIPVDEYGFSTGVFTLTITWSEE